MEQEKGKSGANKKERSSGSGIGEKKNFTFLGNSAREKEESQRQARGKGTKGGQSLSWE